MLLREGEVVQSDRGQYQVQGKIGSESSFGAVFKALDRQGRPVVIKQLLGPGQGGNELSLDYNYTRATFEREAQILLRHNHPQIVRAFDFFCRDSDLFLVMEFINGEDLDQVLIARMDSGKMPPFDEAEAIAIGADLCRVIHGIHQLPGQILYRDLKPRNVMWDAQNRRIKLIDFGTARFMAEKVHCTQALGTPGYAPPEFYSTSEPLSFASDVYTIGATLYELVSGEVPEALLTPTHFHAAEPHLSSEFKAVIVKAMAQRPSDRFQTAMAMADALAPLAKDGGGVQLETVVRNPYPYLSCLCTACGSQPKSDASVFCSQCGGKIHVMMLRILAADEQVSMDLFLDKEKNLIGRTDLDEGIFPDVDLSRYDPECFVSRRHCYLKRKGRKFYIEALETTNPTLVNRFPLKPGRALEIGHQSLLELANLRIKFVVQTCLDDDGAGAGV